MKAPTTIWTGVRNVLALEAIIIIGVLLIASSNLPDLICSAIAANPAISITAFIFGVLSVYAWKTRE